MIEYRDGTFSETMPYHDAMSRFAELVTSGEVIALYAGSVGEIEKRKSDLKLSDRISAVEDRIKGMEAKALTSDIICIPSREELRRYKGAKTDG